MSCSELTCRRSLVLATCSAVKLGPSRELSSFCSRVFSRCNRFVSTCNALNAVAATEGADAPRAEGRLCGNVVFNDTGIAVSTLTSQRAPLVDERPDVLWPCVSKWLRTTSPVHRQNCSVLLSFHTGNQIGARRDAPTRNVPVLVLCKAARATCKQMHAKSGPNCFLRDASREIRDPPLTKCLSSCHVLISTPRIMGSVVEHAYERTLLSTNHGISLAAFLQNHS